MNEQIRKIKDKYAEYWRRIPTFPLYEMNMLQEVREIKRKNLICRVDRRHYSLFKDGKFYKASGMELYRDAYPLTERPEI